MITEAMQFLKEQFRLGADIQEVQRTADFVHFYDADKREVRAHRLRKPLPEHSFQTLDGFTHFLVWDETLASATKPRGPVLVGQTRVVAHLQYGQCDEPRMCYFPLRPTPEWTALMKLASGVGQVDLWRLLISDLHDCVDPALMLAIGSIRVARKKSLEREIGPLGIRQVAASNKVSLLVPNPEGEQEIEFASEYVFTVRRFQGFEQTYLVTTRLEIEADEGVEFRFTPRRLPDVEEQARLDLAKALRDRLSPTWNVFEGE